MCTRPQTLWEIYQQRNWLSKAATFEAFREQVLLKHPESDLRTLLAKFAPFQRILDQPDILERVAYEATVDCWHEGTTRVEFRYAPNFVSEFSGLPWDVVFEAFQRGITRGVVEYPKMQVGLILIGVRDFGPEQVDKAVDFYLAHETHFVGFDLAGNEDRHPCNEFESSFKKLKQHNVPITVHAGEASGPDNMWEAIELLGARRIGHGIACIQDPVLMKYLQEKAICLEVCPTSNWLTGAVKSLAAHPLPAIIRAGVPATINTDDPGIFGITLGHEVNVCKRVLGMSEQEIDLCFQYAQEYRF